MISRALPYILSFLCPLAITLALTPLVREFHRRIGMVDRPDPRRINKVPVPRGGGIAIVAGVLVPYLALHYVFGTPAFAGLGEAQFLKMCALAVGVSLVGLADDKFSLTPRVKLLGQLVFAFLAWWWADLGFSDVWAGIPKWLDCIVTVIWFTGAMNAFNLIDGLDGLAAGIAFIATLGMAGALVLGQSPASTLFYLAFAGGLLGFLRYNYNPASVFLGDSGSMFIGFIVAMMPFGSHAPDSFLVSVGLPMMAMGVPIFDTALAIVRRSVRHLLGSDGADGVMSADSDHLHHRILRASGLSQRRTAWVLYLITMALIATGLCGMYLKSKAAGLWLVAFSVAVVLVFRDMARVELFDMATLLDRFAHTRDVSSRRRIARLSVPFYIVADMLLLSLSFIVCAWAVKLPLTENVIRVGLLVRVTAVFAALVLFNTYVTIWSRAVVSNFVRLFLACAAGSVIGSVVVYYAPQVSTPHMKSMTIAYAAVSFILLTGLRVMRPVVRDFFYAVDCSRIKGRKDISRVLVYGCGLRYRTFRRELVRSTSANSRIIVGIIDDDILLKGHYIGGLKVLGTLQQAPEIVNALNVDAVVVACQVSDEWMKVVKDTLAPTGVKISHFTFAENPV